MRQGVLVTALLFLIGIPTVIYTDGWQGLALPQIHWTGIHISGLRSTLAPRAPDARAETLAANRIIATPAGNATAANEPQATVDAFAAARAFARGASEMRANLHTGANGTGVGVASKPAASAPTTPDGPALAGSARSIEASLKTASVAAANASVDIDYNAAIKWYALAENPDDAGARYAMALDFLNAKPEPDYASAAYWMLTAAQRGNAHAQAALAGMYAAGTGVAHNDAAAYLWYTLAEQGLTSEAERTDVAGKLDRLASTMTPQERAEADQLIRRRATETAALTITTGSIVTIGAPSSDDQ